MAARDIEIRLLREGDPSSITRLAQRDSAPVPAGPLLGARADGRLIAARSLSTGDSIADPFTPTADVQALLAVRSRQLAAGGGGSRLRRLFLRRARAALPSSPPGAGGKLLRI